MIYRGYEIGIEAETARAEFAVDDDGVMGEMIRPIDMEADPLQWNISISGEHIDWLDYYNYTIEEVKRFIDKILDIAEINIDQEEVVSE